MARRRTYPGSIDRRGTAFRVRIDIDGATHTFTLKDSSRSAAEAVAREKYAELSRRAVRARHGLPSALPFSDLLERFEADYVPTLSPGTKRAYQDSLKPIRTYFVGDLANPLIDTIHAHHVRAFLTWRRSRSPDGSQRSQPLSNRTIAKDRAVLHRIFSIGEQLELREGNPVGRVDPPKARDRDPVILTDDEYERLLGACEGHPMLHLWVLVLGETGCRSFSEGAWLRWEDIDLAEGFIWIDSARHGRRTKSGRGRWVPVTLRLLGAMKAHFARFRFASYDGKPSPWVFHHIPGIKGKGKHGERIKSLRGAFETARSQAKLPEGFVAHDLRHRRVTTWLAQGGDIVKVKEAVGHADLRTTMSYTHLVREHLRDLVDHDPPPGQAAGRAGHAG